MVFLSSYLHVLSLNVSINFSLQRTRIKGISFTSR